MWLDVARYGEDDYRSLDPMGRGFNPVSERASLSRLGDPRLQRRPAVRPVRRPRSSPPTCSTGPERLRHLPALGFLGLGPWYYDNGAVEITRADERHDRVDAVSRGMLGLTVGCARCHDHKYDPIPTKDYYSLAGVFLNTEYHEYPLAPKAVVDDYKAKEKQLKQKREMLGEFTNIESQQLAETLAFQASQLHEGRLAGDGRADARTSSRSSTSEKLDYELFDRWLLFLAKRPVLYPFLKEWQALIARGGTAKEAEKLATEFQELLVDVILEQREVKKENDIIKARALPDAASRRSPPTCPTSSRPTTTSAPAAASSCAACRSSARRSGPTCSATNLDPDAAPGSPRRPGLLRFTGWGLEQRLGDDRRALIEGLRKDIEAMEKALPPKYAYVHGVRDVEKPADLQVHMRGNPMRLGDSVPRGFLSVLSPAERDHVLEGQRPTRAREDDCRAARSRCASSSIASGRGTSAPGSSTRRATSASTASGRRIRSCSITWRSTSSITGCRSRRCTARSCGARSTGLSADHKPAAFAKDGGNRLYWRMSRKRMSAEQIRDSVLVRVGRARHASRRAVETAHAARRRAGRSTAA